MNSDTGALQPPPPSRILLAMTSGGCQRMLKVLAGHRLTVVDSMAEADKVLAATASSSS